jgi:hypothetical protein
LSRFSFVFGYVHANGYLKRLIRGFGGILAAIFDHRRPDSVVTNLKQ